MANVSSRPAADARSVGCYRRFRLHATAQVQRLDDRCCRQRTLSDLRHGCGGGELKIIADCSSPSWKWWSPNSCTTLAPVGSASRDVARPR